MSLLLLTNDDGVNCAFLHELAKALVAEGYEVAVVAPAEEKSWIGKAVTRHGDIVVEAIEGHAYPVWSAGGTPSDCVNIALTHLLKETPPVAVVSGINVGYNTTLPMILSSGTVAGALEGACQGYPALAFSWQLPKEVFHMAKSGDGSLEEPHDASLRRVAARAAYMAAETLAATWEPYTVHNINFPAALEADTPVERTEPARFPVGPFFQPSAEDGNRYAFGLDFHAAPELPESADRACLLRGHISHTVLDFAALGRL